MASAGRAAHLEAVRRQGAIIPLALFAPLFIYRLIMAPYWVLVDEERASAESRARLAAIEQSAPHIVLHAIREADLFRASQITEGRRRIYRLHQVWFVNSPPVPTEASVASSVSAQIEFASEIHPTRIVTVFGQWMVGNPPDFVASGDIASEITVPPSVLPAKLNVVLKFDQDSWAYAYSREALTRELDGRDASAALPPGSYKVRILLKGVGVNEEFLLHLTNPGAAQSVTLRNLP